MVEPAHMTIIDVTTNSQAFCSGHRSTIGTLNSAQPIYISISPRSRVLTGLVSSAFINLKTLKISHRIETYLTVSTLGFKTMWGKIESNFA